MVRATGLLTIRWRLRDMQLEYGNADHEPPDTLSRFALVGADGSELRADGGGWGGGERAAEGTVEFLTVPEPGPATLRFGDEECPLTIP
jgi:hypothetical protein